MMSINKSWHDYNESLIEREKSVREINILILIRDQYQYCQHHFTIS